MLAKPDEKLRDLWWYSIMLFCASRIADVQKTTIVSQSTNLYFYKLKTKR
jgi:hypothetical protein